MLNNDENINFGFFEEPDDEINENNQSISDSYYDDFIIKEEQLFLNSINLKKEILLISLDILQKEQSEQWKNSSILTKLKKIKKVYNYLLKLLEFN